MFDETQPEPLTEQDSPNHTRFYADDTESGSRLDGSESYSELYSRLSMYNSGTFNYEWANESIRRSQDDLAVYDAVVGSLELTPHQKRRGRQLFDELPFNDFTNQNVDMVLIAVCVAAHVVREDGRMYHPSRSEENNDDLFLAFLDDRDYGETVVHRCYEKTADRLSEYGDSTGVK